jgi:hypothetical protein
MPEGSNLDALGWLQEWYSEYCDGDWEHQQGVEISTIDNPGWRLKIDLVGTDLEGREFIRTEIERSDGDWIHAWTDKDVFNAAGGKGNLVEMVYLFKSWVDSLAR